MSLYNDALNNVLLNNALGLKVNILIICYDNTVNPLGGLFP